VLELDNLDIKILTHLQKDSRRSFQEIAKQCLTSLPTVKNRVAVYTCGFWQFFEFISSNHSYFENFFSEIYSKLGKIPLIFRDRICFGLRISKWSELEVASAGDTPELGDQCKLWKPIEIKKTMDVFIKY
jgi:hypothetical protein